MSLIRGRRLPCQLLVGLEGSEGGRLGCGGSAGRLSDPLRPSTSSIRASSLPAGVLPSVHQGSRLNPGASDPSSERGSRTSPSVSWLLQPSIPRPEGFGVVAPHHRPVDPERLHHLVSLPHGDSAVSPSFHPSGRLDGLPGPAGRLPAGSGSSRFASLSSLRGRREVVPIQGPLLRSYNRAPSLHEDYGSRFRHPPQVWGQDASLPGRLASSELACLQSRDRLLTICTELGIQVNLTKSSLVPTQSLVYLGMEIRSLPFIARPTPIRVSNLLRLKILFILVKPFKSYVHKLNRTPPPKKKNIADAAQNSILRKILSVRIVIIFLLLLSFPLLLLHYRLQTPTGKA